MKRLNAEASSSAGNVARTGFQVVSPGRDVETIRVETPAGRVIRIDRGRVLRVRARRGAAGLRAASTDRSTRAAIQRTVLLIATHLSLLILCWRRVLQD
jgi:CHASE3 domain sensor protein